MIKNKVLIISLIIVTLLFEATAPAFAEVSNDMVGKYIVYGQYMGYPITYKVKGTRDVDGDGADELFLASDKLISFKAYSQNNVADWRKSTLRTWLNSNEKSVSYDAGNIPTYKNEQGFLTNFTKEEKDNIVPVRHKTLISDQLNPDGGSNGIGWNDTWPAVYTNATGENNIHTAYHVITTDLVFIPSIIDMYDYNITPIPDNTVADTRCLSKNGEKASDMVWTRDGFNKDQPRFWYPYNSISVKNASDALGIRPCFYLKSGLTYSGDGSANNPYVPQFDFSVKGVSFTKGGQTVSNVSAGEINVTAVVSNLKHTGRVTVFGAQYAINNGIETVLSMGKADKLLEAGNNVFSFTVNAVEADNSYIKVFFLDENNKSLSDVYALGNVPSVKYTAGEKDDFYAKSEVKNKVITVSAGQKTAKNANICIIAYKKTPNDTMSVGYINQIPLNNNAAFSVDFAINKMFIEEMPIDGWYDIEVTSSLSDEIIKLKAGVAGDELFSSIIGIINSGDTDTIRRILTGEDELEYNSLIGKGLHLDELKTAYVVDDVIKLLKASDIEYTKENIAQYFNKYVTFAFFDNSDYKEKYKIIENEKYKTFLGTENVINAKYYNSVKNGSAPEELFENISSANIAEKLQMQAVVTSVNQAINANAVMDIVAEAKELLAIDFTEKYEKLSGSDLKKLYDRMIGKSYTDYKSIKTQFVDAYNYVIELNAKKTSSGGGGGGSSTKAPVIRVSEVPAADSEVQTPSEQTVTFNDVQNLSWGKNEIEYLAKKGIVNGYSKELFEPESFITREQFAKIVAGAFQIKNSQSDIDFADLDETQWYYSSVKALYANNIINGISDSEFGVGKNISREDVAVILYRLLNEKVSMETEGSNIFEDMETVSKYAKDAVVALSKLSIVKGYEDNSFKPKQQVTRREASVLIYNVLIMLGKQGIE